MAGSRARARLFAAPGSTIVPDDPKENTITRARRNLDAARLNRMTPDKRDVALVADADYAELYRMEAECKAAEKAKRKAADHARAARRRPHDVLPPFKCSPVAHCPMQATLAQCPEFVMAMERFYAYNRP